MSSADLVREMERQGIRDRRVLAAMERVPRDRFCPPEYADDAWRDDVIPIGHGATLSQPFVVARMLEALELQGNERALDVGSGSGYTTALLCELCGAVYAVELVPDLAMEAETRLTALGYANFHMRTGDGWKGWMEHFPYDAILVSAATPFVPPVLLDQLAPGGRLVAPVGGDVQLLRVFASSIEGDAFTTHDLFPVRFVPLVRSGAD